MADNKKSGSKIFSLNFSDIKTVVINAVFVALAAFLTFVVDNISNIEMGENLVLIVPIITMALNTAIRFLKDYSNGDDDEEEDTPES